MKLRSGSRTSETKIIKRHNTVNLARKRVNDIQRIKSVRVVLKRISNEELELQEKLVKVVHRVSEIRRPNLHEFNDDIQNQNERNSIDENQQTSGHLNLQADNRHLNAQLDDDRVLESMSNNNNTDEVNIPRNAQLIEEQLAALQAPLPDDDIDDETHSREHAPGDNLNQQQQQTQRRKKK